MGYPSLWDALACSPLSLTRTEDQVDWGCMTSLSASKRLYGTDELLSKARLPLSVPVILLVKLFIPILQHNLHTRGQEKRGELASRSGS